MAILLTATPLWRRSALDAGDPEILAGSKLNEAFLRQRHSYGSRLSYCPFTRRKSPKSSKGNCVVGSSTYAMVTHAFGRSGTSASVSPRCLPRSTIVNNWPKVFLLPMKRTKCNYGVLTTDQKSVEVETESSDSTEKPVVQVEDLSKTGAPKLLSVIDYFERTGDFLRSDGGPPRWFCSLDARGYPTDAPLLLFLPGMDSTGLGLLLHQEKLGRIFEVRSLHIPTSDRTPFIGLLELVEEELRRETLERPQRPIYLLGESFGGSLALSIAARNPKLDLVLVLVNPATCFDDSQLQPFLPLLGFVPDEGLKLLPYLLSFTLGNPLKMASAGVDSALPPLERAQKQAEALTELLPLIPAISDLLPRDTLFWKLKMLRYGAQYANSRIHAVKSEILLLASGNDQLLPSKQEALRLKKLLPQTKIRYFKDSGHTLLLEEKLDVASLIRSTGFYRRSKKFDIIRDFIYPFPDEIASARQTSTPFGRQIFSPVFLSVDEDGTVREGLPVLPDQGPILFVGNHTFVGFDLGILVDEFLKRENLLLRGLAHPILSLEEDLQESSMPDLFRLFGAVPVTGNNLYKLLAGGGAVLLYPGGVREALKQKGEAYKLFWPSRPEFVRTAIRHGATIIPFASVGGDDIFEILLNTQDMLSLPYIGENLKGMVEKLPIVRSSGNEGEQETLLVPLSVPKLPPRMYFLFKQGIKTRGMAEFINDRKVVNDTYLTVKTELESGLKYLLRKREEDPYKDFIPRALYEASNDSAAPTFRF